MFSSRVLPQVKRAVFPGGGRKIDLLRHQVNFYSRSLEVLWKQSLKGVPFRVPWVCSLRRSSLHQICLSRGRWIFVSQFLIKRRPRMQFSVGLFLDRE
jgi:hypothetical protein